MVDLDVAQPAAPTALDGFRSWSARHLLVALGVGAAVAVVIGIPTDVIPNPVFGRPVPVTWWSYPTLVLTAVLAGLLAATYVNGDSTTLPSRLDEMDKPSRRGSIAGLLSFFAVGCPVCNKLVIVALGTTGARQWFEPLQPVLAAASIVLLAWALRARLRSAAACAI